LRFSPFLFIFMGQYDKYKDLIIPANIAKLFVSSANSILGVGMPGSRPTTAGPGNEGINLGIWFQEKIDSGDLEINSTDVDLNTAVGVTPGSTDIGIFTGSIISDNTTVINALQELETYIESLVLSGGGNGIYSGSGNIPNNTTATALGTFNIDTTGAIGRNIQFGGISGISAERYGVKIHSDSVSLGNVFGTLSQGQINLNANGVSFTGDTNNLFELNSTGGGALTILDNFIITDSNNLGGIKYGADYSAFFTLESLITKRYVDDALASITTTGGGIYGGSGTVPTTVTATLTDNITFTTTNPSGYFFTNIGDLAGSNLLLNFTEGRLRYYDLAGNSEVITDGSGISLTTPTTNRVIIRGSDARYFANYAGTYSNRSLVDKEYVDGKFSLTGASIGSILVHNGTGYVSVSPIVETQSGISGTLVTLAATPCSFCSLNIFKNGQLLVVTDDYTISGSSLTLTTTLNSSDKITAQYYI